MTMSFLLIAQQLSSKKAGWLAVSRVVMLWVVMAYKVVVSTTDKPVMEIIFNSVADTTTSLISSTRTMEKTV